MARYEIFKNYLHDDDPSAMPATPARALARPPVPKRHFEDIDPPSASTSRGSKPSFGPEGSSSSGQKKKKRDAPVRRSLSLSSLPFVFSLACGRHISNAFSSFSSPHSSLTRPIRRERSLNRQSSSSLSGNNSPRRRASIKRRRESWTSLRRR